MRTQLIACVLFFSWLFSNVAMAQNAAPVRIAILPGEGDRAPAEEVVAQLELTLAENKAVTLLERAQIKRILAEQKLSASGFTDPATTVTLGKLLSVDMFLFVDRIPNDQQPICRVQMVEAATGIVVASDIVVENELEQKAAAVPSLLAMALNKQRVPLTERRYVGLLGFHNEEPGRSLDGLAEAAGMFLMTDIARAPAVIILDRERVDRFTSEQFLSGLDLQIKTSSTLIEGGLRRTAENKLGVMMDLRPSGQVSGKKVSVVAPADNLPEFRRLLSNAVLDALGTERQDIEKVDPETESRIFAEQSRLLLLRGEYPAALRAAEAAFALNPEGRSCYAAWAAVRAFKYSYGDLAERFDKLPLDDQRRILNADIRQWHLALAYCKMGDREDHKFGREAGTFLPAWDRSEWIAYKAMPSEELVSLQKELRAIQREVRDFKLAYYIAHSRTSKYWDVWRYDLFQLQFHGAAADVDDLRIKVTRDIIEAYTNPPKRTLSTRPWDALSIIRSMTQEMQIFRYSNSRANDDQGRAKYVSFWNECRQNQNPVVRMMGCEGLLMMDRDLNAAHEMLDIYTKEVAKKIEYQSELLDYEFDLMLQAAFREMLQAESAEAEEYCIKILTPRISQREWMRLMNWRRTIDIWLTLLENQKRYADVISTTDKMLAVFNAESSNAQAKGSSLNEIINMLRLRRQRAIAKLDPRIEKEDIWNLFTRTVITLDTRGDNTSSVVHGDILYCATIGFEDKDGLVFTCTFSAHQLPTGNVLYPQARVTVPCPDARRVHQQITAAVYARDKVYVGTAFGLFEYTPGGTARVVTEADGAPATEINSLGCYNEELYIGIGVSYHGKFGFSRYDPATGKSEILASSAATEKRSPFDGVNYLVSAILPDAKRKCLWIAISESPEIPASLRGLWKYTVEDGKFEHVVVETSWQHEVYMVWCGENILYNVSGTSLVLFNPDTHARTWLISSHGAKDPYPPTGMTGQPLIQDMRMQPWPAWFDGEFLFISGSRSLFGVGKPPTVSTFGWYISEFHLTRFGLLAVGRTGGQAWLVQEREPGEAE